VRAAIDAEPPLSSGFQAETPLTSERLKDLAAVSFLGRSSTAEQRAVQPADLIPDFANDGAVQYYAYTSQYEDFATLFESAMMKWRFGYDKDTAITDRPASGGSDNAIVAWGTRGRLSDQPVLNRVLGAGQRIYPGDLAEFEAFVMAEPPPQRMIAGETWAQNLTPDLPSSAQRAADAAAAELAKSTRQPDYFLERVQIR
jgi:hypothetical protein